MLWSEYVNTEEYFPAKITQIVTLIIIDYIRDRGEGGGEKGGIFNCEVGGNYRDYCFLTL